MPAAHAMSALQCLSFNSVPLDCDNWTDGQSCQFSPFLKRDVTGINFSKQAETSVAESCVRIPLINAFSSSSILDCSCLVQVINKNGCAEMRFVGRGGLSALHFNGNIIGKSSS